MSLSDIDKQRLASKTEAEAYSLKNPYLSDFQKASVEAIFQLPLGLFD